MDVVLMKAMATSWKMMMGIMPTVCTWIPLSLD